jgi:hypothetical protein
MDFNIHDQNRKDAIAISDFSYDLREAIHKQSPWSKEVIEALVDYHDNNIDAPTLNSILQKRDIRFCEPLSQARFSELYPVSDGRKESVIDILRRLKSNSAHTITLSSCSEVEVNNATEILLQTPAEHLLNSERVCRALEKLNSYLVTAQGQPGITTSVIAHLTWTQQYVAQWIKGLSFEKILGLTHDPVLPHLLKFEELTCNHDTSYDEARWQKVAQELVTESAVTGLHALGSSALGRIVEIERALAKQGLPDVASRLYTGTIAGALVGALYNNKPETVAGARYREEILTPPWLLRTGD